MTVSLRLNDNDAELIKAYASVRGISVSELLRDSVIQRIEDEFDINAYTLALDEYEKNPITYSLDEIEKDLGLR